MSERGMLVMSPDAELTSSDWTKQSWDLPPYMSKEFLAQVPDLATFKRSETYKNAVENGLILDDEWVGDFIEQHQGE